MWLGGLNIPNGIYGIHGTNNPSSIGRKVSHGCIRMYNNDIIELSKIVPLAQKLLLFNCFNFTIIVIKLIA